VRTIAAHAQLARNQSSAFLPSNVPDFKPVEYLQAWFNRHALANYCPNDLSELCTTARNNLKSAQKGPLTIAAGCLQAALW